MARSKLLEFLEEHCFDRTRSFQCESYRFIWTRSFHPLICIRATEGAGAWTLNTKVLEWIEDNHLLTHNVSTEMTSEEWIQLKDSADKLDIWSIESTKKSGIDGATWSLECMCYGNHKMIRVWMPEPGDPLREFCLQLLEMSKLPIKESEIY